VHILEEKNMNGFNEDYSSEIKLNERVAILEERTKEKPKKKMDLLKDYGGIAALLITLLYTFPLGLWQQWIQTPSEKRTEQVNNLKAILETSMTLLADTGRSLSSITNPEVYDVVSRASSTKLFLIMNRNKTQFSQYINEFNSVELIAIGLNYQMVYQIDDALLFFKAAQEKSERSSFIRNEAGRQIAKSYFLPTSLQNVKSGREIYKNTITEFAGSRDVRLISQEVTLRSEWGFFEMIQGDWECGRMEMEKSIKLLQQWQNMINDQGNMAKLIQMKLSALTPFPNQTMIGCN
jgi:hypothetical protein